MKALKMILLCGVVALMAASCGTNENNYRKAYEKAKEKESDGIESTIYNRIREQSRDEKIVLGNDTVDVKVEYIAATKAAGFTPAHMQKYNVVVGQFKQLFHAKSLRGRMADGGYPDAIIVETGEPLYYVVALSTNTLLQAAAVADSIAASSPVKLADGFPVIIRATNR
ncbi:MAG: hypothetical protein HDS52_01535 [Barnesiella sp.]|nr:hypothetical protein [Barnesiella sp.]